MKNLLNILIFAALTFVVSAAVAPDYVVATGVVITLAAAGAYSAAGAGVALTIPVSDARSLFTKTLIDVYKEKVTPMSFLRSFFQVKETTSKNISIQVQRGTEKVAPDVYRHSSGTRQKMSLSSEKIWTPPYYHPYIVCNEHELYDVAIGAQSPEMFARLADELSDEVVGMRNTIERSYELQCSQVLDTGIIVLDSGDNIDFKRQADSLVDKGAGNYWATGTVNPYDDMETACQFLRKEGKSTGGVFNAILGAEALSDFLNNTIVKERADIRRIALDDLQMPQANAEGGVFHGQVSAGSYKVNIWTYEEYYENPDTGVLTPYVDPKKMIMLPLAPRFTMAFAGVPQLITNGNTTPQKGAYMLQEFIDERAQAHEVHLKSAGLAVPTRVDQMHTTQVVAD